MNIIIIPAYEPTELLIDFVQNLRKLTNFPILIVNDGSSINKKIIFDKLESIDVIVIHHLRNLGKGKAIKTAITYSIKNYSNLTGFVTCDADGQHLPHDVMKVSDTLLENKDSLILGTRDFRNKLVPFKSKFGNYFSSFYFRVNTGFICKDTQTGLRGIPLSTTDLALSIQENRYDYEMTFLLKAAKSSVPLIFIPIDTVYLDDNSSSHFRPLIDSIRIYKEPLKFSAVSIMSAIIDITIFTLISLSLNEDTLKLVFIATVFARALSGTFNFLLNRIWSFRNKNNIHKQFVKYLLLYLTVLGLSIFLVYLLSNIGIHLTIVKIFVDGLLFITSYFVQKKWVFKKKVN